MSIRLSGPATGLRQSAGLRKQMQRRFGVARSHRVVPQAIFGGGDTEKGFADDFKKVAKQVRDGLPIIGLISRITTPEGIGGDEIQTYPEFCRQFLEDAPEGFNSAMVQLEKSGTTQTAQRRFVMICLWMCKFGAGILQDDFLAKTGMRLPITRDIETEMDRFEMDRVAIVSKYPLMEPPKPDQEKGAVLAVDALSACCYGVKQTDGLPDGAGDFIGTVVSGAFPEVSREAIDQAVLMRPTRSYT